MDHVRESEGIGFQSHHAHSVGNQVLGAITDSLWFLDPQIEKLESRGIKVPAVFGRFLGCKYNDPKKHKKKTPKVDTPLLYSFLQNLKVG